MSLAGKILSSPPFITLQDFFARVFPPPGPNVPNDRPGSRLSSRYKRPDHEPLCTYDELVIGRAGDRVCDGIRQSTRVAHVQPAFLLVSLIIDERGGSLFGTVLVSAQRCSYCLITTAVDAGTAE